MARLDAAWGLPTLAVSTPRAGCLGWGNALPSSFGLDRDFLEGWGANRRP